MSDSFLPTCSYSIRLLDRLTLLDTQKVLDFDLINKAIYWAKKYHDGQFRKSGEPYYTHPLKVAYLVSEYNLTTNVIVTAILHDIVEDTEVTAGMILDEFSWRIAEMVDRLTRDRPDGSKLSVEEILNNAYAKNDKEVLLIKVIDRLHNMQTIGSKTLDKIYKTSYQTFNLFISLAVFLENLKIETEIFTICHKIGQKKLQNPLEKVASSSPESLLSRVYQNNSDLYQNLYKQELI